MLCGINDLGFCGIFWSNQVFGESIKIRVERERHYMKNVILKCKDVKKIYKSENSEVEVIRGVSLEIYDKDFTVIMGNSGSGKSTLLYMLSGLDNMTSGKIFLDNTEIGRLKEKEMTKIRRNKIGFVFQSVNLIPNLSVLENVTVPGYLVNKNKKEVEKRAKKLLNAMGLEKELNRGASHISGGQQQRAAIARGLINNPSILFADEPTGALNSKAGQQVLDVLSDVNKKGQTIVMVTHDIMAAVRADRILFLRDGVIDGTLEMKKYSNVNHEERERKVFEFIKEMGW